MFRGDRRPLASCSLLQPSPPVMMMMIQLGFWRPEPERSLTRRRRHSQAFSINIIIGISSSSFIGGGSGALKSSTAPAKDLRDWLWLTRARLYLAAAVAVEGVSSKN